MIAPELVILGAIGLFIVLILIEMQVAIAIAISGTLAIVIIEGPEIASRTIASVPYTATAKYALLVIPMYILLGCLIANTGIGTRIYSAINRGVRRLPGGLAASAVLATSVFSGISGSSAADVATFGRVSVNEMSRHGYSKPYAAAVVAAAGTFAVLIPPSIPIVIYSFIAGVNTGAMILGAVVPGVLSGLLLTAYVVIRAIVSEGDDRGSITRNKADNDREVDESERHRWREILHDFGALGYAAILFAVVVGGLYSGVFTAIEAGAVGAFVALIIAISTLRGRPSVIGPLLWRSLRETTTVTSMIFLLMMAGGIFAAAVAYSRLPNTLVDWASSPSIPPKVVVLLMLVALLVLGAVLDGLSIMLLTVPIMAPVVLDLGFDGVWFGVLVIKVIEIGLIHPPFGTNAYIISGIAGVRAEKVFGALVPFVILDLGVTAILFLQPELCLWLPRQAGLG